MNTCPNCDGHTIAVLKPCEECAKHNTEPMCEQCGRECPECDRFVCLDHWASDANRCEYCARNLAWRDGSAYDEYKRYGRDDE